MRFSAAPGDGARHTRQGRPIRAAGAEPPAHREGVDDPLLRGVAWKDWPGRNGRPDTGIDIVAKHRDRDGYAAIQCKFYDAEHRVSKGDLDTFLAASGGEEFVSRLLLRHPPTTGTPTPRRTAAYQACRSSASTSPTSPRPASTGSNTPGRPPRCWSPSTQAAAPPPGACAGRRPRRPGRARPRQADHGLRHRQDLHQPSHRRGTRRRRRPRAVPGPLHPLLSQSLREWMQEAAVDIRPFAVCSDVRVGRKASDDGDISVIDLTEPATTDAAKLVARMGVGKHATPRMDVVFSTYQSIDVIAEAQKNGLADFDLIICDEAHRTTGVTLADIDESAFVKIHDNDVRPRRQAALHDRHPSLFGDEVKRKGRRRRRGPCRHERRDPLRPRAAPARVRRRCGGRPSSPTTRSSSWPSTRATSPRTSNRPWPPPGRSPSTTPPSSSAPGTD